MNRLKEIEVDGLLLAEGKIKLPLRDITIVTGRNGAGKSRFIKALETIRRLIQNNEGSRSDMFFFPKVLEFDEFTVKENLDIQLRFELEVFPKHDFLYCFKYKSMFGAQSTLLHLDGVSILFADKDNLGHSELFCQFSGYFHSKVSLSCFDFNPSVFLERIQIPKEVNNEDHSRLISNIEFDTEEQAEDFMVEAVKITHEANYESFYDAKFLQDVGDFYHRVKSKNKVVNFSFEYYSKEDARNFRKLSGNYFKPESLNKLAVFSKYDKKHLSETRRLKNASSNVLLDFSLYFSENQSITSRELFTVFLLIELIEEQESNQRSMVKSRIQESKRQLKLITKEIGAVNAQEYGNKEEQLLFDVFPSLLENIQLLFDQSFSRITVHDYQKSSSSQPGLPEVVYNLFKSSDFRSVDKGSFIDEFLKFWLKRFLIGESLELSSTNNYFEATIIRGDTVISINELSKGEKKVVYFLLSVVNMAYPVGGFSKFLDAAKTLYNSSPLPDNLEELLFNTELINEIYRSNHSGDDFDGNIYDVYVDNSLKRHDYKFSKGIIYLEEPEANLHPNNQSLLADLIIDVHYRFGLKIMVETHSEYLIRKLQYFVGLGVLSVRDLSIGYMERGVDPNFEDLEIQKDGTFKKNFGVGFLDESTRWKFELLKVKNLN